MTIFRECVQNVFEQKYTRVNADKDSRSVQIATVARAAWEDESVSNDDLLCLVREFVRQWRRNPTTAKCMRFFCALSFVASESEFADDAARCLEMTGLSPVDYRISLLGV